MGMGWCHGPMCVEVTYRSDYCADCQKLRSQHASNHRLEGHTQQPIAMCPTCEKPSDQDKINELLG